MKPGLSRDAATTRRFTVDRERTIGFMGEALRVYATPSMVRDLEMTCRDFLYDYLEESEDSVGARVEIDHLGPTLLGMWVEVTATVVDIDGRRITFEVEVRDAVETVGRGRHVRFAVDLARQKERLEAKAARARAPGKE
jgi:fluoroacetyl-CoA thioesterase